MKSVKSRPRSVEGSMLSRTTSGEGSQRISLDESCQTSKTAVGSTGKQRDNQYGTRPSVTVIPASPDLKLERRFPSQRLDGLMNCSMESFGSDIIDLQFEPLFEKSPESNTSNDSSSVCVYVHMSELKCKRFLFGFFSRVLVLGIESLTSVRSHGLDQMFHQTC